MKIYLRLELFLTTGENCKGYISSFFHIWGQRPLGFNSIQPVEAFLVGILVSYFTDLHCHELSL